MSELSERRAERAANLAKLPPLCFAQLGATRAVVLLKRGDSGYYPTGKEFRGKTADELNAEIGVTRAQAQAMLIGSMFGYEAEGADPERWSDLALDNLAAVRKGERLSERALADILIEQKVLA